MLNCKWYIYAVNQSSTVLADTFFDWWGSVLQTVNQNFYCYLFLYYAGYTLNSNKLFYIIVLCISCQEECFQVIICSHVRNAYEVIGAKYLYTHCLLQE